MVYLLNRAACGAYVVISMAFCIGVIHLLDPSMTIPAASAGVGPSSKVEWFGHVTDITGLLNFIHKQDKLLLYQRSYLNSNFVNNMYG